MAGPGRPGPECGIQRAFKDMSPADREIAHMVIEDTDGYEAPLVARSFTELLGRDITTSVVKHHRQGECRCEPKGES